MTEIQNLPKHKDIKKEHRTKYILKHQIVDQLDPITKDINIFDKVNRQKDFSVFADQASKQYQILGKFDHFKANGSSPNLKCRVTHMINKMKEEHDRCLHKVLSKNKISIPDNLHQPANRRSITLNSPRTTRIQKKKDNKNQVQIFNNSKYDLQKIEKRQIFDYIQQIQSQIKINQDLDQSQNFQTRDFEKIQQQKRDRIINNYTSYNNQWQQFEQKAQEAIKRASNKMLISTSIKSYSRKLGRLKFANSLLTKQEQDLLKERDNYWISTLRNNDNGSTHVQTENNELFEFEGNASRINIARIDELYRNHTEQDILVNDITLQDFQLNGTNKLQQEISYLLDKKMGSNNYYKVKIKSQPAIKQDEIIAQDSQYLKTFVDQNKFISTIN